MTDSFEQLQVDARAVAESRELVDSVVLRAIGLGCETRRAIKDTTGFDYAAIEKALEREAGSFQVVEVGGIERMKLVGEPGPVKTSAFNPFTPVKDGHITRVDEPKSNGARGRQPMEIDYEKVERLRGEGKSIGVIADILGMSRITICRRRKQDLELDSALTRGHDRYLDRRKGEESTMARIEQEPVDRAGPGKKSPKDPEVDEVLIEQAAHELMDLTDWNGCSFRTMLVEFEARREILRRVVKDVVTTAYIDKA